MICWQQLIYERYWKKVCWQLMPKNNIWKILKRICWQMMPKDGIWTRYCQIDNILKILFEYWQFVPIDNIQKNIDNRNIVKTQYSYIILIKMLFLISNIQYLRRYCLEELIVSIWRTLAMKIMSLGRIYEIY